MRSLVGVIPVASIIYSQQNKFGQAQLDRIPSNRLTPLNEWRCLVVDNINTIFLQEKVVIDGCGKVKWINRAYSSIKGSE